MDGNLSPPTVNRRTPPVWHRLLDRLLPQPCRFCASEGTESEACCDACRADLPWAAPGCGICALPLESGIDGPCGLCLADPPGFTSTTVAFAYQWPVDGLIKALKYRGRLADAALLGSLLARRLTHDSVPRPQRLVPVPMHDRRLRQRGFNQAQELARTLRRQLGIPVDAGFLERARETRAQTGLSATARRRNLQGAFRCTRRPAVRHVALVDDVVTTGTTVRQAATCLLRHGVERVDVWAVARAR